MIAVRRAHGFTLIELMITVALIGIVAAIAIPTMRAAARNASVNSTSFDLLLRLQGLKTKALADQRTFIAVVVDAPGNDGTGCIVGFAGRCARVFILQDPTTAWKLDDFDAASPGANASVLDAYELGRGIRFAIEKKDASAPPPFGDTIKILDAATVGDCDGRRCMAVRYLANGEVHVEAGDGLKPALKGIGLALGTEMADLTRAAESRAILVACPSGIVKSYGL